MLSLILGLLNGERVLTGETLVGRHADPEMGIKLAIPTVSRQHCLIYPAGGTWWVADRHSLNGTFRNGVPVLSREPLAVGDVLEVGGIKLSVLSIVNE